ncbi:MAG: isopentenyl phosphate kinase [Chloroflexota bacterium]
MSTTVFLKLGGSLITEKTKANTPRLDTIKRLVQEISAGLAHSPHIRLILGHGSGSFGHMAARQFGTRQGVHTPFEWKGFAEVWHAADALNRLVTDALYEAGLPVISFSPASMVISHSGGVLRWDLSPLKSALEHGLLPLVYGDVIFDNEKGGTILSTEDLFVFMAKELHPQRILLAGIEPGVWADYPTCTHLVGEITPQNSLSFLDKSLGASAAPDVTGGMAEKVRQALEMVRFAPDMEVLIFSGEEAGNVQQAISGKSLGTRLY